MLRFLCFQPQDTKPLTELHGAHLLGNDSVPVRGNVSMKKGEILCQPRTPDPVALALLWPVNGYGTIQLETTRLPERKQPYILNLELARHRLMRITLKREEWGLFDYHGMSEIGTQIEHARELFVKALQAASDPPAAARYADQSLKLALWAADEMCRFHATVFLERRQQSGGFGRQYLGVAVQPCCPADIPTDGLQQTFDFVRIPFVWRDIQPEEHEISYDAVDRWTQACAQAKLNLRAGPLLNFGVQSVPDWMYIWDNDFDTILDYAREHIERTVKRYANEVNTWIAASGLHADNVFAFNFEQIMEITRVATATIRHLAPRSQIVLDLVQPWGEYFARNQRTVPPLLYADMAIQSGIGFDAFGVQFIFGIGSEGYHLRDPLQISALIDRLANFGRPLHITAVAVPSAGSAKEDPIKTGGQWRGPWTDQSQADWLLNFCEIALSKPYVESVCLQNLTDCAGNPIPTGGILHEDLTPKPAFARLVELRQRLSAAPAE
ncbi:MAG: hypothetical protein ABIG44_04425 [Planctomycetota bacterium]